MKYAVIAIAGTQFLIEENQSITVTELGLKEGEKSSTDQVLLIVDGDKTQVGIPTVDKASVEFEVLKNYLGDKTKIFRYKGKSRYRKASGFRAHLTDIKILKINN